MNDRVIVRTLPRDGWVTIDWTAAQGTDYPPAGQLTGEIELDLDGNMYLRFRNDNDDPFVLVLDGKGLRIYNTEDLPPNDTDPVAFDAEQSTARQWLIGVVNEEADRTEENVEGTPTRADYLFDTVRFLARQLPVDHPLHDALDCSLCMSGEPHNLDLESQS